MPRSIISYISSSASSIPLSFAVALDELERRGTEVWIRHVVVPGLTDDDTLLDELVEFVRHYKVCLLYTSSSHYRNVWL